ncbi:hypothetical protein HDU86_003709 [Geranomyces michiganensis]|nr:hypothetical protein HDU86_003709 [Geranomyces michiganensis]
MTVAAPQNIDGNALCVGASSGIGAAVAVQFAKQGASVVVIGRSENLLKQVVADARAAAPNASGKTFDYIVADLSTIAGIKAAVKDVQQKFSGKGVQYIVQTQGATPNGVFSLNEEGYDKNFTVQVLSRFAIPYLLAKSGTFKEGNLVSVCAPGGKAIDLNDIDFGKAHGRGEYGKGLRSVPAAANRDSACVDAFTLDFKEKFPKINAAHIFPGIVASTNALRNFPGPISTVMSLVSAPLGAVGILHTAPTYAHIPVNYATSGANGLFKSANTPVTPTPWIQDQQNRRAIWQALEKMLA